MRFVDRGLDWGRTCCCCCGGSKMIENPDFGVDGTLDIVVERNTDLSSLKEKVMRGSKCTCALSINEHVPHHRAAPP
jgi:hypothetical protein